MEQLIRTVLSQVHPQMNMTNEAVAYLLLLMNDLQPQFQNVTSIPELNTKIQQIARHAIEDVRRATDRSGNDINTARNAFYEYIIAEILGLAGNRVRDREQELGQDEEEGIDSYDVIQAIRNDQELNALFASSIPVFPYGTNVFEVAPSDALHQRLASVSPNYGYLSGFISGLKDYLQVVENGAAQSTPQQVEALIQHFRGDNNLPPTVQNLSDTIVRYVVNTAGQKANQENRVQLGFIDLYNALAQAR